MKFHVFNDLQAGHPSLREDEIHLWILQWQRLDADIPDLSDLLSEKEKQRSGRFAFDVDRWRFKSCRGVLRHLLSRYLSTEGQYLSINETAYGKPYLAGESIRFNVSHSCNYVVVGVSLNTPLGVDLEHRKPQTTLRNICDIFTHPCERTKIKRLTGEELDKILYTIWVRKEALFKGVGTGLHEGMRSVCVITEKLSPIGIRFREQMWGIEDMLELAGYSGAVSYLIR
jgi:4'-phosphopantetheinyl transferase